METNIYVLWRKIFGDAMLIILVHLFQAVLLEFSILLIVFVSSLNLLLKESSYKLLFLEILIKCKEYKFSGEFLTSKCHKLLFFNQCLNDVQPDSFRFT